MQKFYKIIHLQSCQNQQFLKGDEKDEHNQNCLKQHSALSPDCLYEVLRIGNLLNATCQSSNALLLRSWKELSLLPFSVVLSEQEVPTLPFNISESGRVPESFRKWVAVNFQFGYLETEKKMRHLQSVWVRNLTKFPAKFHLGTGSTIIWPFARIIMQLNTPEKKTSKKFQVKTENII